MSSVNGDCFIPIFLFGWLLFLFPLGGSRISSTILNKSSERGHSYLVSDLIEYEANSYMVLLRLKYILIQVVYFLLSRTG